jgi:hypothetical protein
MEIKKKKKKNLQNLTNLGHFFFNEKSFVYIGRDHIVQVENWQDFTKEKKTLLVGTISTYVKN